MCVGKGTKWLSFPQSERDGTRPNLCSLYTRKRPTHTALRCRRCGRKESAPEHHRGLPVTAVQRSGVRKNDIPCTACACVRAVHIPLPLNTRHTDRFFPYVLISIIFQRSLACRHSKPTDVPFLRGSLAQQTAHETVKAPPPYPSLLLGFASFLLSCAAGQNQFASESNPSPPRPNSSSHIPACSRA